MIGFGFSAKPRGYGYSISDQATLQETLLQEFGIDRVHILAHDYGDSVAQEMLARYERRRQLNQAGLTIRSICFLNGGLFIEAQQPRPIQKILRSPAGRVVQHFLTQHRFSRSFARIFGPQTQPGKQALREFWKLITYNHGPGVTHDLLQYLGERSTNRERWVHAMQQTSVPMRLIDGIEDPVSGASIAERYRELIRGADVVELPTIGHYPQIEAPERVIEAYWTFLQRIEQPVG